MSNFAMEITYDGTRYHGWQRQNNGVTVQEIIEKAIRSVTGERVTVCGCSRTDSGVHARSYILNFKSETTIPEDRLPLAINSAMKNEDVRALHCKTVDDDFSARFSNKGKEYVYQIYNRYIQNPFLKRYAWHVPTPLDFDASVRAARMFEGTYDFSAFMASGGSQKTTVRTVHSCTLSQSGSEGGVLTLKISADAFLYNMVRIIAGTVVFCGLGKIKSDDIPEIIKEKDRRRAGVTAPGCGLFLNEVYYGKFGEKLFPDNSENR